ncbi:hypothetical protein AYO20_06589 [Fonsecaea nubica]|uniref:Uncharacterized protein n=1 Tax=Fonsecaea nubica TaxID=856822 RepID=A0A178CY31_9EURO|nr:hypothetical protein AYO20_06589 [Fonsecaea nubica]OAL34134.1 hypothetical protein AYO20_06589 [Fonsecaea nubica]
MSRNSFRLAFDEDAYERLGILAASAVLDVSLCNLRWSDKLIGHVAIQAREELNDLWKDWAKTHKDRKFATPPTAVTALFDEDNCRLFICTSVKGMRAYSSFLDRLSSERRIFIDKILSLSSEEGVEPGKYSWHMFQANCAEVHALCQWHLARPGDGCDRLKDAVMATAGGPIGRDGVASDVVLYNPCGRPPAPNLDRRPPGCKELVELLRVWALNRSAFEKCKVEDVQDYSLEPVIEGVSSSKDNKNRSLV